MVACTKHDKGINVQSVHRNVTVREKSLLKHRRLCTRGGRGGVRRRYHIYIAGYRRYLLHFGTGVSDLLRKIANQVCRNYFIRTWILLYLGIERSLLSSNRFHQGSHLRRTDVTLENVSEGQIKFQIDSNFKRYNVTQLVRLAHWIQMSEYPYICTKVGVDPTNE